MRRLNGAVALLVAVAAAGCASVQAPPGGPPDDQPPELISVTPDSGAIGVRPGSVMFRFDEVINERPQGARELAQLVLISPFDGEPRVNWRRTGLEVRPRGAWRANTVYTITLLPGIADLRGNVRRAQTEVSFSTGGAFPPGEIAGVVFDWVEGRPAAGARVEALHMRDSVPFVTRADTTGRFRFRFLSPGTYRVLGWRDANMNRTLDAREPFDSAHVALDDSARVHLYAFIHDTIAPGVESVELRDSVTLRVRFDRPVDPTLALTDAGFRVQRADSAAVPVTGVMSLMEWQERLDAARDTLLAEGEGFRMDTLPQRQPVPPARDPARFPVDTVAVRRDRRGAPADTSALPQPVMDRPLPVREVFITLGTPLAREAEHRLTVRMLRGLTGAVRGSTRVFTTPAPPPLPATDTAPDTVPPAAVPPTSGPPASGPPASGPPAVAQAAARPDP